MKRQGEVEAEYHAAHSYIQKLQDEISQVLDGILITESTPCSPTPSQNRNPPPPSETIPTPAPSITNPHTPHPTSRTREVRAEDVTNIVDIAGRKPLLEDVTNIQHAEHKTRTSSEHHHPSGPRHLSRSFDAELYWTGRKISVEDTRPRPQKEGVHHNLTFGRRRRTSLGEYGERYGGTTTLGRRVASLSGHRRSSLGDYQGDCRDSTKFDWARHRQSPRELKTKQVNVIREEHGDGTSGKTCKKSTRDWKDQGFVSGTSYNSDGATCVTSTDTSSLKHSAEIWKVADEGRTLSEVGKASNFSPPDPKDQNNTAEICRRVRELRNSIAESIEKQRQCDSDVQESISSPPNLQQVEPPAPCEKQAAPRDQTSALCLKTKEAEESSNKASAGTVVSSQGSNKASTKVSSSLCCVSKQEKGGEGKADRDHTDHHSAEEEQGWYRHYDVTDIPLDPQIKVVSPGTDSVGWPAAARTAQNRPTTLKLPVSHGELLPHPPADSRQDVFQSDGPWPLRGVRRSEVLQSVSETTESSQEEESPKAVPNLPSAAEESSVNAADRTGRFQLTPIANEDESASSESSGDDSDSDRSSCVDVRDIEQQGPTVDLQDTAVDDDTEGVKGSELQGYTTDLRDSDLHGHIDDVSETALQDDVSDARDTEPQGHSSGVRDTEPRDGSEEPIDLQASDRTTNLVKEPQLWGYTAHLRDTESQDDAHDLRDSGSQVVDESDAEVPEQSAERWLRQTSGDEDHKNLQSTVSPPMTVCEQAVQLPLPQHDQPNDPTFPPPHHALSHPLPCSAGGPGAEPPQGAALDPLSQRPHHDTLGHHDLSDVSAHGPLSEGESDQQASSRVLSLPADGETPGVDLPKAVVGEGNSEASTSSSETSAGCISDPSRTDQQSERTGKDEGSFPSSHKQKDPTQCLVDSLPHNHQLPAIQCRDAEVQTMSDSALNPAHFLPHVDTACQTSPVDCVLFAGSPREDLAMNRSADVSTQQPEVLETTGTTPESADHILRQEGNVGFSDSSLLESTTTAYASSHVGDQQNGKQAAHFGTSHEVKRADVFSESKKRPSGKGAAKSHKQKNGGKLLTEHSTAKALVNKIDDNQCKQSKSRRGDESQSKQSAQNQRDSHSGHANKDRKRTDQRHQAETNSKPSEKTPVKRTPSSEKTGKENFSFLPDEEPEMQVMVNSLTPVLQRRKSARRSNSHTGVSSSDDVTPGCEDLQNMLASFTAPSPPQERHKPRVSEQKTPGSSLASSKLSSQQPNGDEASSHRTSHLFIKPKFARTWHGPVQAGHGRAAAPKMGVAMMTSDPSSLTLGASARAAGGQGYNTHVHTMPVISRTLLDALHKRYCGYQYTSGSWVPTLPFPPLTADVRSLKPTLLNHPSAPVPGVPVQKLNSEGESDSGSLGTSSESSPRTGHTQAHAVPTAGPMSSSSGAAAAASSSAASSLQKHNGQTKKEEIEAVEACQWLRAAGFPQYAQMFEDGLFPVDISDVQRDHDFLDSDSIQSVIRRLNILNTCSVMKIDAQPCKKAPEESDEEDQCALSSNWEYQKAVRRWSRKLEPELSVTEDLNLEPSVSHDSLLGEDSGSHTDESPVLESKMPHSTSEREPGPESVRIQMDTEPPESIVEGSNQQDTHVSSFPISPKLRRAASERLKSALKKMESFKKKSKKYPANRNIVEISDPVVSDQEGMQAKLERLNCVDISPGGGSATPTPHLPPPPQESTPMDKGAKGVTSPDSSYVSPLSPISPAPPASVMDKTVDSSTSSQADASSLSEYYTAHSQLLASFQACSDANRRPMPPGARKSSDSSLLEIFLLPQDHKPGSFPRLLKNGYIDTTAPFQVPPNQTSSTSSLSHGGRAPAVGPASLRSRVSVYDNLSPGSPQHTFSPSGHRKPEDIPEASSGNRHSQVLRSFSVSSSGNHDSKMDLDMSSFAGMVRSQSASAATSLEHEVVSRRRGSDGVGREVLAGEVRGERKLSEGIEELDAMLQILLKDISSLSSGYSVEEVDSQDVLTANSAGATSQREVSFSISDHNGSFVRHSNTASVKEDGQLSQTSTLEGLAPSQSFTSAVDDSMEAEEGDMSSQDSSEEVEGSADETLERIIMEAHERRDSGVGSSLTRASRERTRKKMRWESFKKCHRPSRASRELQIGGLSVCQLLPLRQLSLLKLTSIMEKCSPTNRSQWSWSVPRFMKRHKAPQFSDKNVFGVPFTVMLQRTGQPLPQCVLYAMRYLRKTSHDAIGIFRKSGVRSRIQKLRDMVEACPDTVNFDELQPYDVADLLKQYFRELPECLLTNKLSDTFRSIFSHVPLAQRLEALQTAVVLLPEENREVLHCLLLFLGDIAEHADKHQMNASNLAVCFAPSLFNFMGSHGTNSPKRQRKGLGVPEQRELLEQKAVHECFTYMIIECKKLFMVPPSMYSRLHLSTLSNMEPVHLDEFYAKGKQPGPDYKAFGEEHIQILLKEAHDKNRGWAPVSVSVSGIEVLQRKPQDGHPMRQWKCSVEIEAPPIEVLNRILHERHKWDDDMLSWNVVERLDKHCDVFHYALNSMAPHPPRHFMVIRYWRPDLVKGACAMVSRSVEHSGWKGASEADYDQGVRAVELGSYYLMEPCGSGRSRLTYIARTDMRGRCPEWYNRVFGHLSANYLDRLRDSFRQEAEGPETKV